MNRAMLGCACAWSLAATVLSVGCSERDRGATTQTQAPNSVAEPAAIETIHVEPEAKQRFEMMSGRLDNVIPVTNAPPAPVQVQPQPVNVLTVDEQKLKAQTHKDGALLQGPVTMTGGAK